MSSDPPADPEATTSEAPTAAVGWFDAGLQILREEMEQQLAAAQAAWEEERQQLQSQIAGESGAARAGQMDGERRKTEGAIAELTGEIESMVADANVRLSDVMRKKSELTELQAYLRGLQFESDTSHPAEVEDPSTTTEELLATGTLG